MVKYFCDCCGKEVSPPTRSAVAQKPLATIEEVDPTTGKTTATMVCTACLPKLNDFIKHEQKKNGIIPISKDFNFAVK